MIKSILVNGWGTKTKLKIDKKGAANVSLQTHPPFDEDVTSIPFRQVFSDDGTTTGSTDLRVNGSTAPVEFWIPSSTTRERYIKSIVVVLKDQSATLEKFGNLTALTNGCLLEWRSSDVTGGVVTIYDSFKINLDFFEISETKPEIVDLSGSGADAIIVPIKFDVVFGLPYGLHLKKGKLDRLVFTIRDDLSVGIDEFNIIGYGLEL